MLDTAGISHYFPVIVDGERVNRLFLFFFPVFSKPHSFRLK